MFEATLVSLLAATENVMSVAHDALVYDYKGLIGNYSCYDSGSFECPGHLRR